MNQTMKSQKGRSTVLRLAVRLKGQRIRLTVVLLSAVLPDGKRGGKPESGAARRDRAQAEQAAPAVL